MELFCDQSVSSIGNGMESAPFEKLKTQFLELNKEKIKYSHLYYSEKELVKTQEMQCNLHKEKYTQCKKELDTLQQTQKDMQGKYDRLETLYVQLKLDYANLNDKYNSLDFEFQKQCSTIENNMYKSNSKKNKDSK
ncbi:hypothetical protein RFI_20669 [Reticulomyxa filosa]|uniref:Uncharacterized protein n=1 Tax=Reticulomyxa filosa TaxID=46433 RepID=X6MS45_RETFI|nr:hypothetical protein RFI_20669 [Reticulomyxa filosa]|eukprot:ETO16669.1 hypothetical protein RFI_20669 [Reticulomyxa filosa]